MGAPLDINQAVRLAGYQIVGPPIRGGMSTIHPARRLGPDDEPDLAPDAAPDTPPDTAIKILDGVHSGRLHREAELLGSVDHPAIARFIEVGQLSTGAAFLASAWVDGSTLHARLIDNGSFDVGPAVSLFEGVASGLQHLHDRGIVHGDLSPNNIMVDRSVPAAGGATLIDFGISRGDAAAFQTVGTDLAGTPRYLAPEVIGGGDPSPASDQFSAGIVLYEMLTGTWPYPESPTAANALHHQLSTAPTPLIERLPDAPPALDQAIQRALRKEPSERFTSMDDFVAAIHRPAPAEPKRPRFALAAVLAASGLAAAAALLLLSQRGDEGNTAAPPLSIVAARTIGGDWEAGDAAALDCNLLDFVDFDDRVLPRNWYINPIEEAGVDVVEVGGQDNSPALRIGFGERYGLWGEQVPIEPGETYVFAGTFITEGGPDAANFTLEWYDADSNGLLVDSRTVDLTQVADGRVSLTTTAPADARFAVTRVFKDSSVGSLLADEFVLANATDLCADQL